MTAQRIVDGLQELTTYGQGLTAGAQVEREAVLAWLDKWLYITQSNVEHFSVQGNYERFKQEQHAYTALDTARRAIATGEHITPANESTGRKS